MAEVTAANDSKAKKLGRRSTKKSTRVDLTPMVDLGFLLITFFIFTTTLSQQNVLTLAMPHDGKNTLIKNSGALTILLGKDNHVFYYEGKLQANGGNFKASTFKDIRNILITKKKSVTSADMFVIIKPTEESSYGDVVNILDEMSITVIKSYALDDITDGENKLVRITESQSRIL